MAIVVRVSAKDGMGHFYRVLGLFPALGERFASHVFLVGNLLPRQSERLGEHNWTFCESDSVCEAAVLQWDPDLIIFDTLTFAKRSFESLSLASSTVSISPVFEHLAGTDIVFHRTDEEPPEWKTPIFSPKVYKGLQYALMSPGVAKVEDDVYALSLEEPKLNVGLSMGGADSANDTLRLLNSLSSLNQDVVFWVVLGEAYSHDVDMLMDAARRNLQEMVLIRSDESMWRLLRNVSVVVTAGGMTTYEAAKAGVPSITLLRNPSWHFLVSQLEKAGVTVVLVASQLESDALAVMLQEFIQNRAGLLEMRKAAQGLGITNGGNAVAEALSRELETLRKGPTI